MAITTSSAALRRQSFSPAEVEAALRVLPSHGWTGGWTGRRDRALLVLSYMAGLSYDNIAELTVADVTIIDGVATIRTPGGTTTLPMVEDDLICGPCALARWLHALDMTVLYPTNRVIAAVIARAAPLTANSPHLCLGTVTVTETTSAMSLLNALNQPVPATSPIPEAAQTARSAAPVAASTARTKTVPFRTTGSTRTATRPLSLAPTSAPVPALSGRPESAGAIPTQRTTAGVTNPVGLKRSKYAKADIEPGLISSGQVANGLEGRARQLIEHPMSDVTGR